MLWDEIIENSKRQHIDPKQLLREQLQKTILTSFSQKGYFNTLVFQGGTALRLCYDNPRFSEDLDFFLKNKEKTVKISWAPFKKLIFDTFPFLETVNIQSQKSSDQLQRHVLTTMGLNPSQKSRIHIEIAKIPSYENHPKILSYPPFNPAIQVETKEEILADKLTAFGCRAYIKGRDLWDIYFLTQEKNKTASWKLVRKKIKDYNVSKQEYLTQLDQRISGLEKNGEELLRFELQRFLPQTIYDHYKPNFSKIIQTVIAQLLNNTL
jgi:predicted nucleotidyltransferase component of viral defense system